MSVTLYEFFLSCDESYMSQRSHSLVLGHFNKLWWILEVSCFGGLEVACWPLVPKFASSNPVEAVGFLRVNKNPQRVGGHGCLSVVTVVCCQVEVSGTN